MALSPLWKILASHLRYLSKETCSDICLDLKSYSFQIIIQIVLKDLNLSFRNFFLHNRHSRHYH